MKRLKTLAIALVLVVPVAGLRMAAGESAPDLGRPFVVRPLTPALYGIKAAMDNPEVQRHIVEASDGTEIFTETWLPETDGENVPPERVPTIVVITPYTQPGFTGGDRDLRAVLVPRGYAYTVAHVRGTGGSGGCMDFFGAQEVDDSARVIEYVGRDAPWSNGIVGGWGFSYYGGTLVHAAARGDQERVGFLKAIGLIAPVTSAYDVMWRVDGVQSFVVTQTMYHAQMLSSETMPQEVSPHYYDTEPLREEPEPRRYTMRAGCWPEHSIPSLDQSGDMTPYFVDRDARPYAENVRAATLMFHGHADLDYADGAAPLQQAGYFERLTAPKAGVFGTFGHERPSDHSVSGLRREWERADFYEMVLAWFDHHLRGEDSGVSEWPVAQVQGTDGQWRAEPDWPITGGPAGQLALGPELTLGQTTPSGATRYTEGLFETTQGFAPGTSATFETPNLADRLELTGQPVLDLWVTLDRDDAHIAARIDIFDAAGEPIPGGTTYGLRSAQHLEPLVDNRFAQSSGIPAPVGVPVRVQVRFQPTDLVVPAGGTLRLTIAGSVIVNPGLQDPIFLGPSQPSFAFANVTILHDCEHVSALRFLMPRGTPDLLNVREKDEAADELLADNRPFVAPVSDAGGLATAPVCGQAPIRLENFGPEIPYEPPS